MSDVKQTVRLFKKLKAFPSTTLIIIYILFFDFLFALVLSYILNGFTLNIQNISLLYGYFLLLTFVLSASGYLTLYGDKALTFRRHLLFSLLSLTLFSICWITFSLFSVILTSLNLEYFGFLCGLGIVTAFRLTISTVVGSKSLLKRILNAILFPIFIFLLSFFELFWFFRIDIFWYFLVDELTILFLWGFSAVIFLYLVNMPIKLLLDVNGLTMFRGFTEKWLSHDNHLFEESLDKVAHPAKTKIDIGIFYREKDHSIKSILINPWIHPGPFDEIGSSNLPYLLMTQLKKYGNVFVFHSATTHAFNIPKEKYVREVIKTIESYIISKSENKNNQSKTFFEASPLARIKFSDMFQITYQVFGNYLLPIFTASPNEVDDISPEVGELYLSHALRKSNKITDGTFVDAHNCISSLGENVFYETPLTQSLLSSVDLLLKDFSKKEFCKLKIGIAHKLFPYSLEDGYGPGGINILITESCDKIGALIILDGNNMYPKIREQILVEISDLVDTAEVLTTDTHIVNGISTTGFGYFPLGAKGNIEDIIKLIREGILEAKNNLEPVFFDWNHLYIDTKILGSAALTKLLSGINISAKIAKYFIFIATPVLILLSLLLTFMI